MKLIGTTVSGKSVRMRYATDADPAKATEWLEFQMHTATVKSEGQDRQIPDLELEYLAELHKAALLRARETIDSEIRRLRELANRSF
jgi:hypothetical protein